MIKMSIIGAGRIGQIHAQNLAEHPDCELVFVADICQPAADALAKKVSATPCDVTTATSAPAIDAVIICSSTDTHSSYCINAADAGKAIFCEKPLDLSLDRAMVTARHIKKKNVLMALGFHRRFDPSFAALKHDIKAIGSVEQITIISRDPSPPPHEYIRVSGGLFKDMMIHDFDMARWLLPEKPHRLIATGSALVDPNLAKLGDIDSAMVILETPGGVQCHITNSRRARYGYDQRIEVFGSNGLLRVDNQHVHSVQLQTETGCSCAPINHFFLDRYEKAYKNELNSFIEVLMGKNRTLPKGEDGVLALQLAEAADESLKTGSFVAIDF